MVGTDSSYQARENKKEIQNQPMKERWYQLQPYPYHPCPHHLKAHLQYVHQVCYYYIWATIGAPANTTVDQIMDIWNTLMHVGVPVRPTSYIFGDNKSVVDNASIPISFLSKRE